MNTIAGHWHQLAAAYRDRPAPRDRMLLFCLFGGGLTSLVSQFLAPPVYDHRANVLAGLIFWALAAGSRLPAAYVWICNLGMLTAVGLLAYIASCSGGINSTALVWLIVLSIPALLFLGRAWAWTWVGVILTVIVGLWLAVVQGWIDGVIDTSHAAIVWATMDKIFMAVSLIVVVNFYERAHQERLTALEQSNHDLEAAQQALAQTQSHKDDFMASMGHELRTPMNAILGLNGVLQAELADRPEEQKIAAHIRESAEQLLRLVNGILDFSQLEAGQLRLLEKPVHLQQFLDGWMPAFSRSAAAKGLHLQQEIDPRLPAWLMADAPRLRQILSHLLDNAIKFTDQGEVRLRILRSGDLIRFEVRDSGPGIAADRQKDIFNCFEHADLQTQRRYGGTGLGLAICEQLVKIHDGRIGVRSQLGQGACFWFEWTLRTASPPAWAAHASGPAAPDDRPLRLLLIDDSPLSLMVTQQLLHNAWPQARISTCTSGEQALALLETEAFDLVFMDMLMPGLDGPQTTRRLRLHARPEVASTPVVGFTASNSMQDLERCLGAGMNDILTKPAETGALRDVVQRLVRPWQEA